jgi:hypothetical protein
MDARDEGLYEFGGEIVAVVIVCAVDFAGSKFGGVVSRGCFTFI